MRQSRPYRRFLRICWKDGNGRLQTRTQAQHRALPIWAHRTVGYTARSPQSGIGRVIPIANSARNSIDGNRDPSAISSEIVIFRSHGHGRVVTIASTGNKRQYPQLSDQFFSSHTDVYWMSFKRFNLSLAFSYHIQHCSYCDNGLLR